MDCTICLPNGTQLTGEGAVVVIGPNGSGKTRNTRALSSSVGDPQFINALRNTRVAIELQPIGVDAAKQQYENQKSQSRHNHWEMVSDFDWMLAQILAQASSVAIDFMTRYQAASGQGIEPPAETTLSRIQETWKRIFPGRELRFPDWKPAITSTTTGQTLTYSGNLMSDGEKSALYLLAQIELAHPGVVVVDEPETHFHSLLAVRLWNALEKARPDIRFVYVTHDLTFALSRRDAHFVLSSPVEGLKTIDVSEMPSDVAEALLGSASLSFYASRVVFCEGDESSLDTLLYGAWFNGPDTVVKGVGSGDNVLRCVQAFAATHLVNSLEPIGLIDGDFYPERFKENLPVGVSALKAHEIESLFALPKVVKAVADHMHIVFDEPNYLAKVRDSVNGTQKRRIIVERWRSSLLPFLDTVLNESQNDKQSLNELMAAVPAIFDHASWDFSPEGLLKTEQTHVEQVLTTGNLDEALKLIPGKQLLPLAAGYVNWNKSAYVNLIVSTLASTTMPKSDLQTALEAAYVDYLPQRYAVAKLAGAPL